MIERPLDVLTGYPVRKSKKQKVAFRADVSQYLRSLGYEAKEEKGSLGAVNLVFGNQEGAEYLITAHYDTCAQLPFPNFITPCNIWIYLAYQLVLVTAMLTIMFAVDFLLYWLIPSAELAFLASYLVLLGLLFLMIAGPANNTNANDNTSGVVTALEIASKLSPEQRSKVCFVLFDLEEAGLFGSMGYRGRHKQATDKQIVLNLDCVGDGDEIVFFPCKKIRKNAKLMQKLSVADVASGKKKLYVHEGFSFYPSDQANFPLGVGIAALRRHKSIGLYMDKIHTSKDTILEEENVQLLSAGILRLLEI